MDIYIRGPATAVAHSEPRPDIIINKHTRDTLSPFYCLTILSNRVTKVFITILGWECKNSKHLGYTTKAVYRSTVDRGNATRTEGVQVGSYVEALPEHLRARDC
jgi:hypothetical protein